MTDEPIARILSRAQRCLHEAPTIILGSGASVDHGIPSMHDLTNHVIQSIDAAQFREDSTLKDFTEYAVRFGIEKALADFSLDDDFHHRVLKIIWSLIRDSDASVLAQLFVSPNLLPLTRLYRHLFTSTHTDIHVVTTNYDRLAEYAAEAADYAHYTGFSYGHLRRPAGNEDWHLCRGPRLARTVRIWKVHGSIDWFTTENSHVVAGLDPQMHAPIKPLIVTPGEHKYRITHEEPFRTIISRADAALESARAYLIIGYGFNDDHIQPKLLDSIQRREVPTLVLTKELSEAGRELLCDGASTNYMIFESDGSDGTRVHFDTPHQMEVVPCARLWRLRDFLRTTLSI